MNANAQAHTQLLGTLTRVYHRLMLASEQLHGADRIAAGERSILLLLSDQPGLTISKIARERAVSRQFAQRLTSALIAKGLINQTPDPNDKRAPKLDLTQKGRDATEGIVRREASFVRMFSNAIEPDVAAQTQRALAQIDDCLIDLLSSREQ